jgi:general stress protein YciG
MIHRLNEGLKNKQLTVSEAGRLGGNATLRNQGQKHFRKIGRRGGKTTARKFRELLSEFGKKGGRSRRPSLGEAMEEGNR